jgi:hypothetical protein
MNRNKPGKFRRRKKGALDMNMGIDQPGDYPSAFKVDRPVSTGDSRPDYPPVLHGKRGMLPFTGERIEDLGVGKQDVGGTKPPCSLYQTRIFIGPLLSPHASLSL